MQGVQLGGLAGDREPDEREARVSLDPLLDDVRRAVRRGPVDDPDAQPVGGIAQLLEVSELGLDPLRSFRTGTMISTEGQALGRRGGVAADG